MSDETGTVPETRYDAVPYPTALFARTHPDRLAALARLHGLTPPAPTSARVLEIGAGDAMQALALGASYPRMDLLAFDLAAEPVARGAALAAAARLANVRVERMDILDGCEAVAARSFDYVIAHGVYAWVPEHVRAATLALIGHALTPNGVALVSYNALPGGHIRRAMREMLFCALEGVRDGDRIVAARTFLQDFASAQPTDDAVQTALRRQAEAMLTRPGEVLFHDELGPVFAPQSLTDVADAAGAHGLKWLGDAGTGHLTDGFAGEGVDTCDASVLRAAQAADYANAVFFRHSLFVRAEAAPARIPDLAALAALFVAGRFTLTEDGGLSSGETSFVLKDGELTTALRTLSEAWPGRIRIGDLVASEEQLRAMLELADMGLIELATMPERFERRPGPPQVSPLARAQVGAGQTRLCTLEHALLAVADPAARAMIERLDGSADIPALDDWWEQQTVAELPLCRALDALEDARLLASTPAMA